MGTSREDISRQRSVWWREPEVAFLVLLVVGCYFLRLDSVSVRGEESRWAIIGIEMMQTGDWIVPRQQGTPYVDRPPLHSWLMVAIGLVRGSVDLIAIRLPSAIAILLTTLLIYAYARAFLARLGAMASAAVFATLGQVLQLGRLGENEAVFTLLITASLLLWHWGYQARLSRAAFWSVGYAFAATGALQKGIQAPVYFAAAIGMYLLIKRDWRTIFSWGHAVGIVVFATIIAAWEVPFLLATDLETGVAVWTRTAVNRFRASRLLEHLALYPLETLACLLPWSPMLLGFVLPGVRRRLGNLPDHVRFAGIAVLVAYPSVWFTPEAKGRYFMPLYPCIAIMIGFLIERCATAAVGTELRHAWNRFLIGAGGCAIAGGLVVSIAGIMPMDELREIAQPVAIAALYLMLALATAGVLFWACRGSARRAQIAVAALAIFVGVSYAGPYLNSAIRADKASAIDVARLKQEIPATGNLVSLGPIFHRFAYWYDQPIAERHWPTDAAELGADIEYFCFDYRPGDSPDERRAGRGLDRARTSGTLPFDWEQVAFIRCEGSSDRPARSVIIGRVIHEDDSPSQGFREPHYTAKSSTETAQ